MYILGVGIDNLTPTEAVQSIDALVQSGKPHQVVTVNPEFLVMAQSNKEFRRILNAAPVSLADGVGLLWAARITGSPLKGRVTGVDTVLSLAGLAAEKGYRVFLLGAKEGIARSAGQRLQERWPGLCIAGTYAGSPAPEEDESIVARVQAARPHLLFVAYGAPQQEFWIDRNLHRLQVTVAMGVGGAFDYISGATRRAPSALRRLGLEWLFRLIQEPWRWRRMLRLPLFVALVLRSVAMRRPKARY